MDWNVDWKKEIEGLETQLKQQEAIFHRIAGALDFCRVQAKREEDAKAEKKSE